MRPCFAADLSFFLAMWGEPLLSCVDGTSGGLFAGLQRLLVEPAGAVRRAHQRSRHHPGEADLERLVIQLDELLGLDPALDRVVAKRGPKVPVSYTHLRAHETDSYLVC